MGKLLSGINGAISGKVGTITGSSRNGVAYIKANSVRKVPPTKNELVVNERFSCAHRFLKPILPYVREGFRYQQKIGFNGAKSYTLLNAMIGEPLNSAVDPALVMLSLGNLPLSENLEVHLGSDGTLNFSWDQTGLPNGNNYDQLMPLAYNIEDGLAYYNLTGAFRKSGEDNIAIPTTANKTYHIYAAFTAADRKKHSNSVYLGMVNT